MRDYTQQPLTDQEVQGLFAEYLPLHTLPVDLAARLTSRVMCEVANTFGHNAYQLTLPLLATLHRFFFARKSRPHRR